jgi:Na+-transporting methylmalonyl-CoA/oxaloacetate decarboxylase gamma subunit
MSVVQTGFFLMAAGMGTVFVSLAIFFVVISLLEKLCKPSGNAAAAEKK